MSTVVRKVVRRVTSAMRTCWQGLFTGSARIVCRSLLALCSFMANRCSVTCVMRYYWDRFF